MGQKGVAQKGKGIADKGKGKAVAENGPSGAKRKRDDEKEKSGVSDGWRRNDSGVLRFFDDAAAEADGSDASDENDFLNDFMEEDLDTAPQVNSIPGNSYNIPVIPKEEEMDEDEFDKMMEERYKNSSAFFSYAENDYENKRSIDRNSMIPSEKDPVIWKVKCSVGRERYLAFCLMQKYVDLKEIGTKLQIISALSVEHVKGFIFVEADKQFDISEACNGIGGVYASRVMPVPRNEVARLLTVRSEYNEISAGMWARVKNGKYKGDLGQVVAVNNSRKRATVKLIPRIDLLALTEKYGGGITTTKRTSNAAPRLISSSELEEFRPLIQIKHDRETGKIYEVLDGMMIKDGFLFKKIPLDSLSCWNVVPSEEEILKFKSSENIESDNIEWLSQLYGERKKKKVNNDVQLQGKGESSLGPISTNSFEVHDLVCFGRKDFGVIIGMEKDDSYKILKEGLDCPLVVTVQQSELKSGPSDMKFTALDHRMKSITVNDTVRVTEGPFEGKQGIVKLIYRGIIFLYNQNEEENGGYFCCKSRICEKIKLSIETFNEKGKDSGGVGFEDFFSSSPKSPLSPEKPQQAREFNRDFNKTDNDETFSIGQALRIRVGPLKGYRCRVLAIRRSDVTVKLESKQKVLTVKREHLSEVKTRSSVVSLSEDPGSSSFDMLGNEGGSREGGAGGASDGWDVGGSSSERGSWPTTSASGFSVQPDSGWGNASSSNDEVKTDVEDAWASKVTPKKNLSWGAEAVDTVKVGWGTSMDSKEKGSSNDASASWGKKNSSSNSAGGWGDATTEKNQSVGWGQSLDSKEKDSSNDVSASWGKKNNVCGSQDHEKPSEDPWDKVKNASNESSGGWGATTEENQSLGWGQGMDSKERDSSNDFSASWEKKNVNSNQDHGKPSKDPWGNGKNTSNDPAGAWGDAATEENKQDSWGKGKNVVGGGIWESKSGFSASKDGFNDMSEQKTWDARSDASTWGNDQKARSDASTWGNDRQSQDKGWGKRSAGNSEPGGNEDACWSKKSNWNSDPGDTCGGQDSRWGKKSNRNSESGGSDLDRNSAWGKISACFSDGGGKQDDKSECNNGNVWNAKSGGISGNQDSGWGCKSNWNFESGGTGGGSSGNQDSGWGNKSNWNSESGGTGGGFIGNKDSGWGNKSNWNSESGGIGGGSSGNQDSGWGNKSNRNSESGGTGGGSSGNNDSGRSDKSNWNSESGGTDGGSSGNKDLGWGKKSNWNFESGGTDGGSAGNQDSGWGNKSNWNSESGGNGGGSGGNQDSGWGNKSNWNSKSDGDFSKNQDAGWGNKSNWNSKSGGTEGNHSAWGQKSNWNSEFSNADQKSNWGSKSNWSSGIAWENKSTDAGSEDQTEAISSRPSGGNWRGGRGGRGGFGVRGGDRGGFGGRGRDGGGFGSRGGDRGRFCGRGGDRGGFGGRGRSDRESFGGGGGDRGGFGGRGRGRRDLSGGWNNRDYGGNGSWQNKGERDSGEGRNGAGSWNQGGGHKSEWQGGTAGSWSQSAAGKDGAIWGKGTGSSSGAGGGWGNKDQEGQGGTLGSAETKNSSGGWSTQGSSWSQSAAVKDCGSWGKGAGSSSGAGGGWGNKDQEAGWKGPNSTTQAGMWATGSDSSTGHGGSWGNNSKSPGASGGAQWGNSNNSDQNGGCKGQNSGSWSKGTGSSSGAGGWGNKDQEAGWQGLDSTATDSSTGKGGGSWGNNSKSPGASGGAQWGSSNATGQDGGWKGQNSGSWKGQNSGSWSKGTGTSTGGGGSWGNDGKSAGASVGSQWPMSTPTCQEGPSAQAGGWDKGTGSNTTGGVSWGNNGKAPDASTNEDGGWKGTSSTVKAGGWGNQGSDGNSGGLGADTGSKSTEPWGKAADKSWGSGGGKGGW